MASLLNTLDPFNLKQQVARLDDVRSLGERFTSELDAARTARRALLPLPLVDRPDRAQTKIFPPFKARPIPSLRNKKVGLLLSGGSGACVAACGVARALEEAGIEPQAISVCSGSALWGSMMAAGLTAQEMVDQSLNWQPEDYLDIQWTRLPRFALAAMRGFTGLAKGEAIEKLFDRQLWHMTLGEIADPDLLRGLQHRPQPAGDVRLEADARPHDRRAGADRDRAAAAGRVGARRGPPVRRRRRGGRVPRRAAARARDSSTSSIGVNTILPRGLRGRGHLGLDRIARWAS